MAVSFQIDSMTMPLDPYAVEWEPKEEVGRAHSGKPLFNIKRLARLRFDDMSFTNFNTIAAYDDGATHTVKIPAPYTGTYTNYAGAYIRVARGDMQDLNVYGPEFEVDWIEL